MSLWGNQDNLTGPTPVTVVGTASSDFWTAEAGSDYTAAGIATGMTIILDGGDSGFVTIEHMITPTLAKVGKMSGVGTDVNAAFTATYSTQPVSLKNDPGYAPSSADGSLGRTQKPTGITTTEATATTGTVWEVGSGWVGVTTYMGDTDEVGIKTLRVKKEILVAMSTIDAGNRPYPGSFGG